MSRIRVLPAFVLFIGMGIGTADADKKVDWSSYLEKPGDSVPVKHAEARSQEPAAAAPKAKALRNKSAKRPSAAKAKRPAGKHH